MGPLSTSPQCFPIATSGSTAMGGPLAPRQLIGVYLGNPMVGWDSGGSPHAGSRRVALCLRHKRLCWEGAEGRLGRAEEQ